MFLVFSVAQPAAAQYSTPIESFSDDLTKSLSVVVGGSARHDSNIFKRPAAESDTISSGYVGLRMDKPYSQQRFQLDVTESATRYDTNTQLNFDSLDYRGAWIWQLGSRLSGRLSADHKENLAPFEDTFRVFQRNVRTTDNRGFNLDGWVSGGWHLLLGVTQTEQKSELILSNGQPDFRSVTREAGIKYLTRAGNSIIATTRSARGEYLNVPITLAGSQFNDYRQDESEVKASWLLTGHSSVTGRLTWLERHNDVLVRRDFSGLAGDLGYIWTPTGKLNINLTARRDIFPYQDTFATYRVSDTVSLVPTWQITAKTSARMRISRTYNNGRGGLPGGVAPADTLNSAEIGVDWAAMRKLTVGASLQRQQRSANDPLREFDATIASIRGTFTF